MSDKVRGGTPKTISPLCLGCRQAFIARGLNREELVYCGGIGPPFRVTFPVVECNRFDDKSQPPIYEMQNIAWIVRSRNRGPMGFTEGGRTEIVVEPPSRQYTTQEGPSNV
jgi:hypothetical protein